MQIINVECVQCTHSHVHNVHVYKLHGSPLSQ